ncbi:MAG: hypothetical protein J3R72DRAFT_417655 [Linnemannia gamsii]|nr:MAG: hypothetical protein J3R72DRAFT_417655 [Linnemannia gamsii]
MTKHQETQLQQAIPSLSEMYSDPLSRAWTAFPDHFEIFGRLEIGLTLDQFSKQMTSVMDWSDEELDTRMSTTYYPEALKIISFFGAGATGRIMQYRGKRGYDPNHVREISKSFCPPSDFNGPRSKLLKAHNMGEYGSGGLPDTPGMRNDFKTEPMSSAMDIEREARRYTHPEYAGHTGPFLALIRECRERTANHKQAGHLNEGCQCQTKDFTPMETEKLVLFDTWTQELRLAEPDDCYVAVSQVWFQGIFGQASRKCGACSLDFLETTCHNIGMRYAWIDTLCMPTDSELRGKVVGQLRNIYLNAAATLVVDAGLISTIARNTLDLSLAILLSDWSSRVWTLQEGVLASKLLFCIGEQVMALPQGRYGLDMLNGHQRIPVYVLLGYGNREFAYHSPGGGRSSWFLDALLQLAAGRKTSYECDYLYGLSALLPSTPANRAQGPDKVAVEVAQMYRSPGWFDLGMLMAEYDRCKIVGYRWMPLGARIASIFPQIGIIGRIAGENGGLECHAKALIKLTSIVDIYKEVREMPAKFRLRDTTSIAMSIAMKPDIKYWYSTEIAGVFVGTVVKAQGLVFCSVYQSDWHADNVLGFVVSPTASQGHGRSEYQYIERALVLGVIPSTSAPLDILLT